MVRKECKHTSIEDDPHPYCDECAVDLRGRLCTETDTCRNCDTIDLDQWEIIHDYRAKKDSRRQAEKTKRLNFLHAKFGHFTKPFVISNEEAANAVSAVVSDNLPADSISSSSLDSDHVLEIDQPDLHLFTSDSDVELFNMGKNDKPTTSKQSKKNEAGAVEMAAPDVAAKLKAFMDQQAKSMAAFMATSSAADVPESPSRPSGKTKTKAAPSTAQSTIPVAKRSHRISQGRDKKSKSGSGSRSRVHKVKDVRDKSKSVSRSHRRHSRSQSKRGSKSKRKRSISRESSHHKQRKASRRKRSRDRSHSRRRRSFSHGRKRKDYSRSISSSSSSSDSSRLNSRDRRRKRKADRRNRDRRRSRDSRSRDSRSRSPRLRKHARKAYSRDQQLRQRRSREYDSPDRGDFYEEQYDDGFQQQRRFDTMSQDDGRISEDSDNERVIVEPKQDVFPFREMIALLAKHSDVDIADCNRSSGGKHVMASDDTSGPPKPEFAALTTTVGVVSAIKLWEDEFNRKDTTRVKKVKKRELFKCDKLRSSLRSYKSGDEWANMDPLLHEKQQYAWLADPEKNMKISQNDVTYIELQMRNILRVASFLEVVNQCVSKGFEQKFDEDVMLKLHRCGKHATGDIIKLAANMFCGMGVLRRDEILNRSDRIPPKLASRLRHAPIGNARTLFPEELLVEIDKVYTQKLSNQALEKFASPNQRRGRGNFRGGYQGGYQQGGYNQYAYSGYDNQSEFKRGQRGRSQDSYR